jgi:hypothetical protein
MEKLIRNVAMDVRWRAGEDPVRINVEFDLTNLTREQLADWCVNASSLRVNYQNKVRPKGLAHLKELAKTVQKVVVQPCGTRTPAEISEEEAMRALLKRKLGSAYDSYVSMYDTITSAFIAHFRSYMEQDVQDE